MDDTSNAPLSRIRELGKFERRAVELLHAQQKAGLFDGAVPPDAAASDDWRAFRPAPCPEASGDWPAATELAARAVSALWPSLLSTPLLHLAAQCSYPLGTTLFEAIAPSNREAHELPAHDGQRIRSWLAARQRAGTPASILAAAPAWDLVDSYLERRRLRFRLPPGGSLLWVGTTDDLRRDRHRVAEVASFRLGMAPSAVRRLVGVAGVASPVLCTPTKVAGYWRARELPWVGLEVVAADGESAADGSLAILDLTTMDRPAYQVAALEARRETSGEIVLQLSDSDGAGAHRPHTLPSGSAKRANRP